MMTNDIHVKDHNKWKKLKFWSKKSNVSFATPKITATNTIDDISTKSAFEDKPIYSTRTVQMADIPNQVSDNQSWKSVSQSGSRSVASLTKYPETFETVLQMESRAKLKLIVEQMKVERNGSAVLTDDNTSVLYTWKRDESTLTDATTRNKKQPTSWKAFFDDNSLLDSMVGKDDGDSVTIPHEQIFLQSMSKPQTCIESIYPFSSTRQGENLSMQETQKSAYIGCSCIRPQPTPSLDAKVLSPSAANDVPKNHQPSNPTNPTISRSVATDRKKIFKKKKVACMRPIAQIQQWGNIFACDIEGSLGSNEEQDDLNSDTASYIYDINGFNMQESLAVGSSMDSPDDWTEYDGTRMTRKNMISIAELEIQRRMTSNDDSRAKFQERDESKVSFQTRDESRVSFQTKDLSFQTRDESRVSFQTRDESRASFQTRDESRASFQTRDESRVTYQTMDASRATFQTGESDSSSETDSSRSFDTNTNSTENEVDLNEIESQVRHPMDRVSSSNRKLFDLVNHITPVHPQSLSSRSYKAKARLENRGNKLCTNSNLSAGLVDVRHQKQSIDTMSNRGIVKESASTIKKINTTLSTDTASAWLEHVLEINKSMKRGLTVAEHRQKALDKYAV